MNEIINTHELDKIANTADEKHIFLNTFIIDRLPFFNVEIYFSQDLWDFNDYIPEMGPYKKKYDFSKIHYAYKDYVKRYILELLINEKSVSSISKYLGYASKIVLFFINKNIFNPTFVTISHINDFNEYLKERYSTESERRHNRRILITILKYIERDKSVDFSYEREILDETDTELLKQQIENGKTPNIPYEIYENIISVGIKEINSAETSDKEKIEASTVVLLSQVGMRIHELALCKSGKKVSITCFDNTKAVNYLEFTTFKSERQRSRGKITKSFLTPIGELAYDTLEKLTRENRAKAKIKSDFIFANPSSIYPYSTQTLNHMLQRFMVRNSCKLDLINKRYDGFSIFTLKRNKKEGIVKPEYCQHLKDVDTVAIPTPRQFRVAVCNELIRQGKDIGWVMQHMNHLLIETTEHYVRNDEREKEKAKGILHDILTGEFKLIGEEAEVFLEGIDRFLEEKKFNVKYDLAQIIDELVEIVPIREKSGGYCIKSAFGRKCTKNEFLCAFEMCPNHCTSFLYADITYKRFNECLKVIEYNKANNYIAQAEVESRKLQRLVKRDLMQELEELYNEIRKHGKDTIISKHKNLKHIADNISEIMGEVRPWLTY
ncbi:hypothetical protein Desor_0947 [Desulfosporosinus orientis DSM 765]|uniref:Phage integrase family protein n=1 Tax=Desulfosporosinus orientis (strain ATCC 19365 / DSM 765 / NCIMB 8382 / VKM B-1628 / Singapore I) TaxID=768706 RepID=G7W5H6_DESOD|nr:hypothetical protein [Desulfosporosinus orientis]AET66623.1 hypothetical protein Desor_0947 [Desulfosporosinus orientis DSM 765]